MAKKKKKRTVTKRVSAALTRFLKKQNPAFKRANAVRVKKSKNGTVSFTPVQVVKRQRLNGRRRKNVEQGFFDATGFHPIRRVAPRAGSVD